MNCLSSPEESDSRISSVGRKRVFDQIAAAEDTIISVKEYSSNEEKEPDEKRSRYDQEVNLNNSQLQRTSTLSPDTLAVSDGLRPGHPPQGANPSHSSEECQVDVASVISSSLTWNTGVPVVIRTSFNERKIQSPLISAHLDTNPRDHITHAEVNTTTTLSNQPKNLPSGLRLGAHKVEAAAAVTGNAEKLASIRSDSENKMPWPKHIEKEVEKKFEKKLNVDTVEASRSIKTKSVVGKKESSRLSKIADRLPSSFGTRFMQEEAERIIKDLPEADKNLMPREVADTAFKFTDMGRRFDLPKSISEDIPALQLSKLSFCHPTYSFTIAFLAQNRFLLEFIDFKVLLRAFQEYLRLLYGHLPDRLLSIVCSNKFVAGLKGESGCLNLLNEARKESLRQAEVEKIKTQNGGLEKAEKSAEKSADNAESISISTKSEKLKVLCQSRSNTHTPALPKDIPSRMDTQSHHLALNLQEPDPDSMGRSLIGKLSPSQGVYTATGVNIYETIKESPDDGEFIRSPKPNSEKLQNLVVISDQENHEQMLAESHVAKLEIFHRYHPSANRYSALQYCLICAHTDHDSSTCPSLSCATCGVLGVHFSSGCPKVQRCIRCHERGHQISQCSEKLAAIANGSLSCDICKSNRHLESLCHFMWRSFNPNQLERIKFVADIPINCYTCGAEGHFGSECGIRQSTLFTEGYSWSLDNWKRFIDPQSRNRAISAGKDFRIHSTKGKKGFNIKGIAQQESEARTEDGENTPFIRDKVTKPPRPIPRGSQHIKLQQKREDNEYPLSNRFELPLPDLRFQSSHVVRPAPAQKTYGVDPHEFSYRRRDDSARHMRERSFSPPPRFYQEQYLSRPDDNFNMKNEKPENQRHYGRGGSGSSSKVSGPASIVRANAGQGPPKRGAVQNGRGGSGTPRGKRQRNRKG